MEGFSHLVCATTARDHSPHKGLLPAVASRQQRSRQLVARSPVVPNTHAWWMGTFSVGWWRPLGTTGYHWVPGYLATLGTWRLAAWVLSGWVLSLGTWRPGAQTLTWLLGITVLHVRMGMHAPA